MQWVTYFITSGAARFELFGVVPLAVQLFLVDAVGQIDEQFVTGVALETGRVPSHTFTELGRHDAHRARRNVTVAPVTLLQPLKEHKCHLFIIEKKYTKHRSNMLIFIKGTDRALNFALD